MLTIVSGTNRPNSSTLKLSGYYQKKLVEKGVEAEILSLENLPDNLLKTDLYGKRSEAFKPIQALVDASEKLFLSSPNTTAAFRAR